MSDWQPCRYCDAPARWGAVCVDCRHQAKLPSKVKRKA
jgi:hypothetical protein